MQVTIMYRNSYIGGDGWQYYSVTVEIADTCPVCGGPRGVPTLVPQCEDGEWFTVSRWQNPCGHLDTYKACWEESQRQQLANPA